jgi:PilZ domain
MTNRFQRARDRRRAYRYSPVMNEATLRRRKGDRLDDFPVVLQSISTSGCRLRTRHKPAVRPGDCVWLKSASSDLPQWIEGKVISITHSLVFGYTMRIQFVTALNYDTFKMLVYGPGQWTPRDREDLPEHETDQFWK